MNILKTTIAIALGTTVAACSIDIDSEGDGYGHNYRRSISRTAAPAGLPFSEAVHVGDTLYLSGQIGTMPGSDELVTGGITAETRQIMNNIETVLRNHNFDRSDVVKCTVFMADISEWQQINDVYVTYFGNELPARSALGANGLALNARVEIECIAVNS